MFKSGCRQLYTIGWLADRIVNRTSYIHKASLLTHFITETPSISYMQSTHKRVQCKRVATVVEKSLASLIGDGLIRETLCYVHLQLSYRIAQYLNFDILDGFQLESKFS